jgi:hypothetical protein
MPVAFCEGAIGGTHYLSDHVESVREHWRRGRISWRPSALGAHSS